MLILIIYEVVLATLSGTHIGPVNSLRCGLDDRWRNLYQNKDGDAVRRIQNAFQCCGLHSVLDMAWPFPGGGIGPDACRVNYGRTRSCFEAWRREEQMVGSLMLVVVISVFIWKVCCDFV